MARQLCYREPANRRESACVKSIVKWTAAAVLFALGIVAVMVLTREPSHDRDWVELQARLPQVKIAGDRVTVEGVRNFSYAGPDAVASGRYEDADYDIARLESVWYGIAHFAGNGFAHPFVSFLFDDGRALTLSIEARLEKGETYGPVGGALRNYEVIYVLGTERDVIGLRSHWRGEPVDLYRLVLERRPMRALFRAFMEDVQAVAARPRFYNTLTDNCLTGLLRHAGGLGFLESWVDYRVWLPGYSAGLAYEKGLLDTDVPFEELRSRARIDPVLVGIDDPAFSARIRDR
jgi:hypothetical protein